MLEGMFYPLSKAVLLEIVSFGILKYIKHSFIFVQLENFKNIDNNYRFRSLVSAAIYSKNLDTLRFLCLQGCAVNPNLDLYDCFYRGDVNCLDYIYTNFCKNITLGGHYYKAAIMNNNTLCLNYALKKSFPIYANIVND